MTAQPKAAAASRGQQHGQHQDAPKLGHKGLVMADVEADGDGIGRGLGHARRRRVPRLPRRPDGDAGDQPAKGARTIVPARPEDVVRLPRAAARRRGLGRKLPARTDEANPAVGRLNTQRQSRMADQRGLQVRRQARQCPGGRGLAEQVAHQGELAGDLVVIELAEMQRDRALQRPSQAEQQSDGRDREQEAQPDGEGRRLHSGVSST
nr:hypothetical protein [Thiocapsa sp.]